LFDQIHLTQEEEEEEDMKVDLGDFLEEEDKKIYLEDFLEVLVKEEEGERKEEQETGVLNDSLEVKKETKLTDGLKLLTADENAEIKSRLDGRQIRNRKDLDEFREIHDEMIYQRVKRGTGGNNFWCRVVSCKLRRGQRQKMRDHMDCGV
jgi:hypothetical protein